MVVSQWMMGRTHKVVVCGARGCGKTSILEKAIYDNNGPFSATLEDVYVANVETERGSRERIRFYDTGGLSGSSGGGSPLPRHLLSLADGVLLVYSLEDRDSFQLLPPLLREVRSTCEKKDVAVVVLGTKQDLKESRKVDAVQALNWASVEKVRLCEVSALDRDSLTEPLTFLASRLNPVVNKGALATITSTIKRQDRGSRGQDQE